MTDQTTDLLEITVELNPDPLEITVDFLLEYTAGYWIHDDFLIAELYIDGTDAKPGPGTRISA